MTRQINRVILAAKAADPQADTRGQEAQIDGMVYELYGLMEDEVRVMYPRFPLSKAEYEKDQGVNNE
ncbi:hypothetical protein AGMMS50267_02230 [Spirochaetia bacterium]|nr:hypothetical protein AGMMS50267_02230 [Spirochaetia bacterium]